MLPIYFDIDDTLFPSTEFSTLARKNAVRAMIEMGIDEREEKLLNLLGKIIRKYGSNYPRHFNELCKLLGIPKKERTKFVAAAVVAYHNTKAAIMPFPEVPRVLLKLKEQGRKLCIVSEGIKIKQWDKLIRLGIHWFFDEVFVTNKKSPAFYKKLKKGIVVGDHPVKDVEYAKRAGHFVVRVKRGKHAGERSKVKPDAEIYSLDELLSHELPTSFL